MKIIDLTEEYYLCKRKAQYSRNLITGEHDSASWEEYIDWEGLSSEYDACEIEGTFHDISKWGLGEEIFL